jgi:hypothetical protein
VVAGAQRRGGSGELHEGDEYTRFTRRLGFLDLVDGVWIAETMEELKEARFRYTVSRAYTHFRLTPAQRDTFVELEAGMLPTSPRWRLADGLGRLWIPRWIRDLLDNLPAAVASRRR